VPVAGLTDATRALIRQQKGSFKLQDLRKQSLDSFDYAQYSMLRHAEQDRGKLLALIITIIYASQLAPVACYVWPWYCVPPTFQTPGARDKWRRRKASHRRRAVLNAASTEDERVRAVARDALTASSKKEAVAIIKRSIVENDALDDDATIKALPGAIFCAAAQSFDGAPWPPRLMPKFLHMGAIKAQLKDLADGDAALRRGPALERLSTTLLEEAAADRAIGGHTRRDYVAGLNEWLSVTRDVDEKDRRSREGSSKPAHTLPPSPEANKVRLAMLAANTVADIRKTDDAMVSLYKGKF